MKIIAQTVYGYTERSHVWLVEMTAQECVNVTSLHYKDINIGLEVNINQLYDMLVAAKENLESLKIASRDMEALASLLNGIRLKAETSLTPKQQNNITNE